MTPCLSRCRRFSLRHVRVAVIGLFVLVASMGTAFAQARFTAMSVRIDVGANGATAGFTVSAGGPKIVLIRAAGPSLAAFGIPSAMADPQLTLRDANGAAIASNDNWGGDQVIQATGIRVGAFLFQSASSRDAAIVATLPPGSYTATVTGVGGSTGVALVEVYDADVSGTALAATLSRFSFRGTASSGAGAMAVGVSSTGGSLPVLVRALGPALTAQGVAGGMPDPTLSATTGTTTTTLNDNWGNDPVLGAVVHQLGAVQLAGTSFDSAALTVLTTATTFQVTPRAGTSNGVAQFEIYATGSIMIAPAVRTPPRDTLVTAGSPLTLTVVASALPAPTYQWRKNGVAIAGATAATYTVTAAQLSDVGIYTCVVTNSVASVTSAAAIVRVQESAPPAITGHPQSVALEAGQPLSLTAEVVSVPAATYQWRRDGVAIAGATALTYAVPAAAAAHAGTYTLVATNALGATTSNEAVVTILPGSRLSNLSVRTAMTDGATLAVGMVTSGGREVIIRAAGPALTAFGFAAADVVRDPSIELFSEGASARVNDNWDAGLASRFTGVGAFAFAAGSLDSALVHTLTGASTVRVTARGAGQLLVEAYDPGQDNRTRLINLSVLTHIGMGDQVLIMGFTLTGAGAKRLLIRGVGPSLGALGVTGLLANPTLRVERADGAVVGLNDNWTASLAGTMAAVGAFALVPNSADAALTVDLPQGSYNVIMSGVGNTTGQGIIEIYEVP